MFMNDLPSLSVCVLKYNVQYMLMRTMMKPPISITEPATNDVPPECNENNTFVEEDVTTEENVVIGEDTEESDD